MQALIAITTGSPVGPSSIPSPSQSPAIIRNHQRWSSSTIHPSVMARDGSRHPPSIWIHRTANPPTKLPNGGPVGAKWILPHLSGSDKGGPANALRRV